MTELTLNDNICVYCFFDDGLIAVRIFDSSLESFGPSAFLFLQTALPAIFPPHPFFHSKYGLIYMKGQ